MLLPGLQVINAARAADKGIRLNAGAAQERLLGQRTNSRGTMVNAGDLGDFRDACQFSITFELHSLASTSCIYMSDNAGDEVAWVEVDNAGQLIAHWGEGNARYYNQVLANGITTGTLYTLAAYGRSIFLNGTKIYDLPRSTTNLLKSFLHIGARRNVSITNYTGTGGPYDRVLATGLATNPATYTSWAQMTVYEWAAFGMPYTGISVTLATFNQMRKHYNAGNGSRLDRWPLGRQCISYYLFDPHFFTGTAFSCRVGNPAKGSYPATTFDITLYQSVGQTPVYPQRILTQSR